MKITGIIWFEDIVDKLARKHGVTPNEVREVFENKPKFRFVENGFFENEHVYAAFGRTQSGRYLIVFFIHKKSLKALIISARNMSEKERKFYEKK